MPPPKIFGIGLQRTGTTSLAKALEALGYSVKHGDYTRFPGSLDPADPIYRRYDAFCDTPYFFLYQKLDLAFPGSKFIHTTRGVDAWVESVRELYKKNRQFLAAPAIRLHHLIIYGTADFNERLMRHAFSWHERAVLSYFRGREQDLLTINIDQGFGWSPLCSFLGVIEPNQSFPYVNRRTDF
jgi:hypothetical protein